MLRYLFFFLIGSLVFWGCRDEGTPPKVSAGWYGNYLQVAFHPVSKEVSGIYLDPNRPADSCRIYWVGKLLGPKANLISWQLDKRKYKSFGIIQAESDETLYIVLEADLQPCHEQMGFELDQSRTFQLSKSAPWIRIQSVKRASTVLLNEIEGTDTLKTLPRHEVVRTIQQQKEWVQVSVQVDSSELIGWLPVAHLRRFPG